MTLVLLYLNEHGAQNAGDPGTPTSTFVPAVHKRIGVVDPSVPVKAGAGLG